MTINEAADKLRVHPIALSKIVKSGRIEARKEKGVWNISQAEVDRLLETRYEHDPAWLDAEQVGEILGKSVKTIRRYVREGNLSAEYDPLCCTRKFWIYKDSIKPMLLLAGDQRAQRWALKKLKEL